MTQYVVAVDGEECSTYREACVKMGLARDDREHAKCLSEAADIRTGRQLRSLFVSVLIGCQPAEPGLLFDEFKEVNT